MAESSKFLRIYLNDHRAAAHGGNALVRRAARSNRGTELGRDLEWLTMELTEDAVRLDDIAHMLAVPGNPVKMQLARAGEAIGRLKLNGWVTGYSPLSRLLELEMLLAGIDAKRSLWRALAASDHPELSGIDFALLRRRASEQRDRLHPHHARASALALGASGRPEPALEPGAP